MKLSLFNSVLLMGRIILPAILCVLNLKIRGVNKFEFLLIFGVIIILFNSSKLKDNFVFSLLLSILLSFLVFFLSFAVLGVFKYLFFMGGDIDKKVEGLVFGYDINALLFIISVAIISPLLMFYSYRFLFKIEKTLYFNFVKWISVMILILFCFGLTFFNDDFIFFLWQVVMALALQLILYQEELKSLFKAKNNG